MKIIVISTNAGTRMGGEAIKAYQYFSYLLDQGQDACLVTHARCRDELEQDFPADRLIFVEDDALQKFLWRSRVLGRFVSDCFHRAAARLVQRFAPEDCVLHYLCPISPMIRRYPPKGYCYVVGPLSGNVFHPPAFRDRMGRGQKLQQKLYRPLQGLNGRLFGDMKGAHGLLVSGYERTRDALGWAGVTNIQMRDVVDSGLTATFGDVPLPRHDGFNGDFLFIGRLVEYKGADLAIRAVALAGEKIRLTIYGNGPEQPRLEQLVADLGVRDRVNFAGWLPHSDLAETFARHRGFVFPTLAEANGIVMQEAMMLGLPVITLNWGGPVGLAKPDEALFVEPSDETALISGLANSLSDLAENPERANQIAQAARARAERDFPWDAVGASWMKIYEGLHPSPKNG